MNLRTSAVGVVLLISLALAACAPFTAQGQSSQKSAERLWNKGFRGVTVEGHHKEDIFLHPSDIHLNFTRDQSQGWIGWGANCNGYTAPLRIRRNRLKLGVLSATTEECLLGASRREDTWLSSFFKADPRWHFRENLLVLATRHRKITFRMARLH